MKVIFVGTTGVHHTLVAANLLLGWDKHGGYTRLEGFGDSKLEQSGYPLLIHDDGRGNQIYSLGAGKNLQLALRAMTQFIDVCGFQPSDLWIEPVKIKGDKLFTWLVHIPRLKTLSNMIIYKLIKWQLKDIKQSVQKVEDRLKTGPLL